MRRVSGARNERDQHRDDRRFGPEWQRRVFDGGHGVGGLRCADLPDCGVVDLVERVPRRRPIGVDVGWVRRNTQGTKWDAARGALASLLADSAGKARWGLSQFPPNPSADVCGKAEVDVALSLGDEATILSKVDAITNQALGDPRGSTPTADALKTVRDSAQLDATDRNNYAVLVTDGLPDCNKASHVTAVITEMYTRLPSVKTFVVGLGDGTASDPDLLDTWAVAGHTDVADPAVKYYQANDATGLGSALSQIIGQTTSCSFGLASPPDDPSLVVGTLDGKARPSDATDGYTYDATSHTVTFHGASCAQITSGQAKHVGVVYGCPAPVIN